MGIYNNGQWDYLTETKSRRYRHSSAVKEDRILLIGGYYSNSTEWISADGSPSQAGPFQVRHGYLHCTIQPSADLILVTGGAGTGSYVTEYQLTGEGKENPLTPMPKPEDITPVLFTRGQPASRCFLSPGGILTLVISPALRWPPTPVAANWRSGGRWREEGFPSQGMDYEPPWSVIPSSSPVVEMVTATSPLSCPGTQWL